MEKLLHYSVIFLNLYITDILLGLSQVLILALAHYLDHAYRAIPLRCMHNHLMDFIGILLSF